MSPTIKVIDSPQNALVKHARALERDRALRTSARTYLAWGVHLAEEALLARAPLRQAFLGPGLEDSTRDSGLARRLIQSGVPIVRVTARVLESIIEGSADQGVLLLAELPRTDVKSVLSSVPPLVLAAHGVQDPGNLGSILRSARALGAGGLIALEGSADPFGSRAVRAAMGTQFTLPAVSCTTTECLREARAAGRHLVAADPGATEPPIGVDLVRPTVLLVGNEGAGLPREVLDAADRRVRIPMAPGVSSLNVHAAAVALLYEAARQRGFTYPPSRSG
ncbi:MAG TPA: RNA methyltransferase [Candidatus Polarisedimenticolia bacterium]|nr:RNA methyltransferase [Candidatus Polarisedimenticolia bacterium]